MGKHHHASRMSRLQWEGAADPRARGVSSAGAAHYSECRGAAPTPRPCTAYARLPHRCSGQGTFGNVFFLGNR